MDESKVKHRQSHHRCCARRRPGRWNRGPSYRWENSIESVLGCGFARCRLAYLHPFSADVRGDLPGALALFPGLLCPDPMFLATLGYGRLSCSGDCVNARQSA